MTWDGVWTRGVLLFLAVIPLQLPVTGFSRRCVAAKWLLFCPRTEASAASESEWGVERESRFHPHKAGNIFFWEVCYQSIIYAKKKAPLRSCRIDSPCTTQLTSPRTMLFEGKAAAGVGTDSSSLLISNLALTHLPQGWMAGGGDSHPKWRMWAGQQRREGTEARFAIFSSYLMVLIYSILLPKIVRSFCHNYFRGWMIWWI